MNAKYFSYPWRSDNFSRHLKQQHPVKWDEYTSMPAEEKQKFFVEKESAAVVNMRSFVQPEGSMKARINAKQQLQFTIDADIIETLIFGLLFDDPEEEGEQVNRLHVAKKNAFKTFVCNDEDNTFVIEVKSVLKLNMVANLVAIGVSFRQASKLYQSVKEETGMGVLGRYSTTSGLGSSSSDADKEAHDCIISTIANFSLQLVSGVCKVCAERDNRNNSGDHLPPVLPLELCGVLSRDFVSCLEDQRIRLGHKFSEAEVENIDEQFRKLRLAFKEQSGFSQMLLDAQASCAVQSFEKCWSQLGSEFEENVLWGHCKHYAKYKQC
ncbi:hypothetical protein IV203_027224 [Nitzschia inconspicua]|uniref:Uncharacterized protein n=1 Tax=Nitzschia inconspicua TaxID=303405 RepID=A0A9K3Q3B8_9STRA|nr:hypothetical protein IV203_027224 [Nitzschia inconspicua]